MNRRYYFLSGLCTPEIMGEVRANSKVGLQNAVDLFQNLLIEGMRDNLDNLRVLNFPFIGSWPLNYKSAMSPSAYQKRCATGCGNEYELNNYRFFNPTFFKFFTRQGACYRALRKKLNANDENVIFIYSVHLPFLRAALRLKRKFKSIKVVVIIPDLPEYKNDTNAKNNLRAKIKEILYNYDTHVAPEEYDRVDAYILLTDYMKDRVVKCGQPYAVIEGITTSKVEELSELKYPNRICYTGTLARRYNIMSLVEAVVQSKNQELELHICGRGNTEGDIKDLAAKDPRIIYHGEMSHDDVVRLQQSCGLLVNPRTAEGEYTKYSFPSKTMEYLASGVPTLIYRLPGIPEEYYNYCYSLDDNSVEVLKNKIETIMSTPIEERYALGKSAREFVLANKTPQKQCRKVVSLIDKLYS